MAATPDWTSSISTSAELLSGLFGDGTDRCPKCRKELTDSVRAHLYSCTMLPAEERRQAQEILTASRKLVKHCGQLREAEVAVALLRDAMKQSASEALRRMIHGKLRDGSLPNDGIQATIPGRPGDGSICGACDHIVASYDLMMMLAPREESSHSSPREVTPIPLHADCFEFWNRERPTFTPSS